MAIITHTTHHALGPFCLAATPSVHCPCAANVIPMSICIISRGFCACAQRQLVQCESRMFISMHAVMEMNHADMHRTCVHMHQCHHSH